MTTIFLSPHFDDAVYSCGGWIWDRTQVGEPVEVWTVCAGSIPPGPLSPLAEMLHERWGTGGAAISVRRAEDQHACQIVGAKHRHLDVPDVIYRRLPDGQPVAQSEEGLSGPLPPEERERAAQIAAQLKNEVPAGALLVSPIGLGHHIDHQLTVAIGAWLQAHGWQDRLRYYADYPYAVRYPADLEAARQNGYAQLPGEISAGGVRAWQQAVAAHASQISTFWAGIPEMETAIAAYAGDGGGRLWERKR